MRDETILAIIIATLSLGTCTTCDLPAEAQVPARLAAGASREAAAVTLARFVAGESDGRKPEVAPLDGVRSFLAGTLPDPCARPALHFGSVADMRARFPNAVPIDCGVPEDGSVFITESGT